MTELLCMKDCYLKEFTAKVLESGEGYVVLDRTAFYPEGGGQPSDTGYLDFNGKKIEVKEVRKKDGVRHFVSESIPLGSRVKGVINWTKRYKLMRMHTAQHLLSALLLDKFGAETVGNQIHEDYSRMDMKPFKPTDDDVNKVVVDFNKAVDEKRKVKIYFTDRKTVLESVGEARRRLFERVPASVNEIRIIEIEGYDRCPCSGMHVSNTKELSYIKITERENMGKDTTRIVYRWNDEKL